MYYVTGTYRDNPCDKNSAISGLVLENAYKGFTVHPVANLKELADRKELAVFSKLYQKYVFVHIYYSYAYQRWVATTNPDGLECNNLLSLPIFYPASKNGTTTTFSQCSL